MTAVCARILKDDDDNDDRVSEFDIARIAVVRCCRSDLAITPGAARSKKGTAQATPLKRAFFSDVVMAVVALLDDNGYPEVAAPLMAIKAGRGCAPDIAGERAATASLVHAAISRSQIFRQGRHVIR